MKKLFITLAVILCLIILPACAVQEYTYTVNCSALNVRSQPTTQSSVVGVLYRGNVVKGDASSNGWTKITYNGQIAYVYSSYITTTNQQNVTTSTQLNPNGNLTFIGTYYTTGYDICYSCCGKVNGITASGTQATPGRTIAMKGYPYGTRVYIEGIGYRTVEDTGGFKSNTIDVLCNNHSECYAITGYRKVYLVN